MIITLKGATFTNKLDLNSWMIISDLVGVSSSNTASKVTKGQSYTTTFTILEGYTLSASNVSVICNGATQPLTWSSMEAGGTATLTVTPTSTVYITIKATSEVPVTQYTLTINPTPSTATVTLSGVARKTITVDAGSSVSWSVAASGYTSKSGTWIATKNETMNVSLVATGGSSSGGTTPTGTNWYIKSLDEIASTGKDLTTSTWMTTSSTYTPWAFGDNLNSKLVGKTINAIEIVPHGNGGQAYGTFHVGKYNDSTGVYTSMASFEITESDIGVRKIYQFTPYTIAAGEYFTFNEDGDTGAAGYFLAKDVDTSVVECVSNMWQGCENSGKKTFTYDMVIAMNVGYVGEDSGSDDNGSTDTGSTTWYINSLQGLQDSGNDIDANKVKLQGNGSYAWAFNELNADLEGKTINTMQMMPAGAGTFRLGVFDTSTNTVTDTRTFTIAAADVDTIKTYTFTDLTIPSGKYFVWNCSFASGDGIGYYILKDKLDPLAVETSTWYQAKSTGLSIFGGGSPYELAFVSNIGYTS